MIGVNGEITDEYILMIMAFDVRISLNILDNIEELVKFKPFGN